MTMSLTFNPAGSYEFTTFDEASTCAFFVHEQNYLTPCEDYIRSDLSSLCEEFELWMLDDHASPGSTSLVGILSSFAFESLISPFFHQDFGRHLRLLVEFSAALYCGGGNIPYSGCQPSELCATQAHAGIKVLESLEIALRTSNLTNASVERLKALFLALLATIIAVGYSRVWNQGHVVCCLWLPDLTQSLTSHKRVQVSQILPQDYCNAQKHLLCALAHHLVMIGKQVHLLNRDSSESQIVRQANGQWKRQAQFIWQPMPDPSLMNGTSSDGFGGFSSMIPNYRYHLSPNHWPGPSCRLVGGFGKCILDANLVVSHNSSPGDRLIAEEHGVPFQIEPERFHMNGVDAGFTTFDGLSFGDSSNSTTTISTPRSSNDSDPPSISCLCDSTTQPFHHHTSCPSITDAYIWPTGISDVAEMEPLMTESNEAMNFGGNDYPDLLPCFDFESGDFLADQNCNQPPPNFPEFKPFNTTPLGPNPPNFVV